MPLLDTIHKRKSATKTAIIMALLIVSFFFVGMQYLDPPEEMGIEVNFGTSNTGSGDIQPMTPVKSEPKPQAAPQETTPQTPTETADEVLTQETDDAPVVTPKPKPKPKQETPKPVEPKPKPKPKKPDQSTSDAMNSILNGPSSDGESTQGEGNDQTGGDKGQIDGNPYANSYYGGGSGNGSGYGLKGRSKTSNNKYPQECNEEGRVVVKIEVDRNGKVIKAIPGVKGTTNSAPCLLDPAKRTALSYRFNRDTKAPTKQIGFVIIDFSLGQ